MSQMIVTIPSQNKPFSIKANTNLCDLQIIENMIMESKLCLQGFKNKLFSLNRPTGTIQS